MSDEFDPTALLANLSATGLKVILIGENSNQELPVMVDDKCPCGNHVTVPESDFGTGRNLCGDCIQLTEDLA